MKRLFILALMLIMIVGLIGCSGASGTEDGTTESLGDGGIEDSTTESLGDDWSSEYYDESMKGTVLNLYGVTDTVRPTLDAFEADTGIKVEHLTMKNGEILQRLENEGESGISIADLWFTGGADTFITAAQEGLLLAYKSPSGADLEDNMKDKDGGYWHGTSLTIVNWVVNKKLIEEKGLKMPETWDDLLQPGLKEEVSMSNPASSGTAYNVVTAMLDVKGEEEGWGYLEKLIEQVPFFTERGSDPANLVANGEAIIGINASNGEKDYDLNNPNLVLVYPEDGTGWWPQPVAIVKGTKNEAAAKVFIDWILSKRGMKQIANDRVAAVARTDVEIPNSIIDIKDVVLLETDFMANAQDRDAILAQWAEYVTAAGK